VGTTYGDHDVWEHRMNTKIDRFEFIVLAVGILSTLLLGGLGLGFVLAAQ
jgi:hypothetical protein